MRVLVTGGSGFIGQHVVRNLAENSNVSEVISLDVKPVSREGTSRDSFLEIVGDIRDPDVCDRAARGVDSIIHLAAVASVPVSMLDPMGTHEVNVTGTLNVLEAARSNRVNHVTVASSSAVYGEHPVALKHEALPTEYLSPYAASKGAAEAYAMAYEASYGISAAVFRFFNVFGPGQRADHPYAAVVPQFMSALKTRKDLVVFGDGEQTRDFVAVNTVADILIKSSLRSISTGGPVNIASGEAISLNALILELREIHGKEMGVRYESRRSGDIVDSASDIRRLQYLVPDRYQPSFASVLRSTYDWHMLSS